MDINYYKNFNIDLIKFSNNALINHFNNYGKNENRIYNESIFYEKYPDFEYILYGTINKDLNNYSKFNLQKHFHLHGCKEKRIFSFIRCNKYFSYGIKFCYILCNSKIQNRKCSCSFKTSSKYKF